MIEALHKLWVATASNALAITPEFEAIDEAGGRMLQSSYTRNNQGATQVNFEQYSALMRRLYRVLLEDFDFEDCDECIKEDWANDSQGKDHLDRWNFYDSMFELVISSPMNLSEIETRMARP